MIYQIYLIFVSVYANAHAFLDICGCYLLGQIDDKFGKLLDVDDVLGIFRVRIDDFGASSNLEGLLRLKSLFIGS